MCSWAETLEPSLAAKGNGSSFAPPMPGLSSARPLSSRPVCRCSGGCIPGRHSRHTQKKCPSASGGITPEIVRPAPGGSVLCLLLLGGDGGGDLLGDGVLCVHLLGGGQ